MAERREVQPIDAEAPRLRPLTPKQQRFVDEYLIDLNATQAAIRAGYSPTRADSEGARLLGNVGVRTRVELAKAERAARAAVNADMVLIGLKEVAERCLQAKPVMVYDRDKKAMVPATDDNGNPVYQFDSQGANKALELIGKHVGMFVDKVRNEHTGKDGGPIELAALSPEEREQRIAELLAKRQQ